MQTLNRIAPRSGTAFTLREGEDLTIIDPEGGQVSDLVCFAANNVREALSNGRTFDYEQKIKLTTGDRLWSSESRPMLQIVADQVGVHDFLLTPCSEATFRFFYPDKPVHRGCFGNLAEALSGYDITPDMIPCAFNIFMNVPIDAASGRIAVLPPLSKAGDRVRFRALMDLVVGITACSAYASNGGSFKPIDFHIGAEGR